MSFLDLHFVIILQSLDNNEIATTSRYKFCVLRYVFLELLYRRNMVGVGTV